MVLRYAPLAPGPQWLRVPGYVDSVLERSVGYLIRTGQFASRKIYIPLSQLEVRAVREGDRDIVVRGWVVEKNGWPAQPVSGLAQAPQG